MGIGTDDVAGYYAFRKDRLASWLASCRPACRSPKPPHTSRLPNRRMLMRQSAHANSAWHVLSPPDWGDFLLHGELLSVAWTDEEEEHKEPSGYEPPRHMEGAGAVETPSLTAEPAPSSSL